MRVHRAMPLSVVFTVTIIAVAFALSSVRAGSDSHPAVSQSATAMDMSNEVHVLQGGFWRTDGGFVSTIRIKNVLVVAPIQVTPTLFMADGTAYPLPTVTVPISGVATVNVNDALALAPQAIAPHISEFGSLMLLYKYPTPGHLVASLTAIDVPRSLIFVYMIDESMSMPDDNGLKALEGLWWKHDPGVHGTISLSNTTDQQRTARLRVTREREDFDLREVQLAPHTTQVLALEQFSRDASDRDNTAGGLGVEYNGPSGAMMVTGSLANESIGYSANMPFWPHDDTTSSAQKINLGSAGIMVGKPDPMMMPGFPAQTRFIPYLALRNTTAAPLEVTILLNYMVGSAPVNRNVPIQQLRPFESRRVDTQSLLSSAGLAVCEQSEQSASCFSGDINLSVSYTGHGGDLIVATGSVDQTGNYVFEVKPQGIGQSIGRIIGYWSVDSGNDAMFSIWNPTDASLNIIATLYYGDGSGTYHLPIQLGPQASTTLDVAMLIREGTPDRDGKTIPRYIREGSTSFDTATRDSKAYDGRKLVTMVISGGFFNISNATCGMYCSYCNGYSNWGVIPNPLQGPVGFTATATAQATDSYGTSQNMYGGSWSSTNAGIMSIDSGGGARGISPGQVSLNDYFTNVVMYQGTYCDGTAGICPTFNITASGPGIVNPTINITMKFSGSKSPGDNLSFLAAANECSESLGRTDCTSSTGYWLWNLEGNGVVSDDASNWTVQVVDQYHYKGLYRDANNNLQPFNCAASTWSPDGPRADYLQQPAGQKSIFFIDGPGPFHGTNPSNQCQLGSSPVDSMTDVLNFQANFSSNVVGLSQGVLYYVKIVVAPGGQLDTTNSTAGYGNISLDF